MKKWLLIIAALPFIVSCSENESIALEEVHPMQTEGKDLPDVQLDKGNRWEANAEAVAGIENLTEIVTRFDATKGEYDNLQSKLREEFRLIFKHCTMEGEAHEQLHNYLLPLMELFGKLTLEDREHALAKIESHLAHFDTYFVAEV